MLALTRKPGESILIYPEDDLPEDMTVAELFKDGPIEIKLVDARIKRGTIHSKIGINAPDELIILRDELLKNDHHKDDSDEGGGNR